VARLDRLRRPAVDRLKRPAEKEDGMVALLVLLLILAVFGGLGFAAHVLWFVLIAAVILWILGFFVGAVESGGRRRWYGR
jgi:energy-coupling factor transporter transmembrane protein EcfT